MSGAEAKEAQLKVYQKLKTYKTLKEVIDNVNPNVPPEYKRTYRVYATYLSDMKPPHDWNKINAYIKATANDEGSKVQAVEIGGAPAAQAAAVESGESDVLAVEIADASATQAPALTYAAAVKSPKKVAAAQKSSGSAARPLTSSPIRESNTAPPLTGTSLSFSSASTSSSGAGGGSGSSTAIENQPVAAQAVNTILPDARLTEAAEMLAQVLDVALERRLQPRAAAAGRGESEGAVDEVTSESTRQNELASNETATLEYKPNFTEVMDPKLMHLATDQSRGNLGAGTSADMQSADVWGNLFTQHPPDIPPQPELFLTTGPSGTTIEQEASEDPSPDIYSFLPFAKLGGSIVWIPRHVQTARFFFTADDYTELTSHIRDGDPLTLDKTAEADTVVMMSSIIRSYGTLKQFCQLGPMLPTTASIEQIYAEWLEMRQIGKALARYQMITGGNYENSELSMRGGIRAAVASSLRPFIQAWNVLHANDQMALDTNMPQPGSASMGGKRKAEAGVVEPEEYNPQFNYGQVDLKKIKFSIPTI